MQPATELAAELTSVCSSEDQQYVWELIVVQQAAEPEQQSQQPAAEPAAEPAASSRANNHRSQTRFGLRGHTYAHCLVVVLLLFWVALRPAYWTLCFWLGPILVLVVSVCA